MPDTDVRQSPYGVRRRIDVLQSPRPTYGRHQIPSSHLAVYTFTDILRLGPISGLPRRGVKAFYCQRAIGRAAEVSGA